MTALISLMPLSTALKGMKSDPLAFAIRDASVVFPDPGGPHKISDERCLLSICARNGLPGPRICSCPMYSSRVCGRIRSASGRLLSVLASDGSGAKSNKLMRSPLPISFEQGYRCRDGGVQGFDVSRPYGQTFRSGRYFSRQSRTLRDDVESKRYIEILFREFDLCAR